MAYFIEVFLSQQCYVVERIGLEKIIWDGRLYYVGRLQFPAILTCCRIWKNEVGNFKHLKGAYFNTLKHKTLYIMSNFPNMLHIFVICMHACNMYANQCLWFLKSRILWLLLSRFRLRNNSCFESYFANELLKLCELGEWFIYIRCHFTNKKCGYKNIDFRPFALSVVNQKLDQSDTSKVKSEYFRSHWVYYCNNMCLKHLLMLHRTL